MIKKYLLGLGIAFLGFLGFSNATFQTFLVGNDKYASNWNNQYDIGFLNKGRFLTNYLGIGKALVGLDSQYLIFWNDGLYLYTRKYSSSHGTLQGYFQYYKSCDEITTDMTGDSLQNCSSVQNFVYNNDEIVNNFMSSLVVGDFVFIDEGNSRNGCGGNCSYYRYTINICFSSSFIGKTMCFVGDKSDYESSSYGSRTPFIGSLGFGSGVNFSNINSSYLQNPPGFEGGNISNSSSQGDNVSVGGNVVYGNCTNGQALQWYRNYIGINDFVCYGGLDSFNYYTGDYLVTPGKGLTVFDLYEYENFNGFYSGFNDWLQTRSYNYTQYINGNSNTTFDSDPTVFKTYFGILYRTFGPAREIHDYCRLLINSDLNGNLRDNPYIPSNVKNELCENIVNSDTVENPGQSSNDSGTIVSSDWSGIGNTNNSGSNLSGGTPVYDGTNFINSYFNKLKGSYSNPSGTGNGILPGFIVIALLGVIFFKFLRK